MEYTEKIFLLFAMTEISKCRFEKLTLFQLYLDFRDKHKVC